MATRTTRKAAKGRGSRNRFVKAVKDHPMGALAVAGGAVAAAALLAKAANTTAKVVTIKAAAGATKDVVNAVKRPPAKRRSK